MTIKFSAGKASRKWGCGGLACGETAMVIAATLLLVVGLQAEVLAAPQRHGAGSQDRAGNALAGPSRSTRGPGAGASSVPLPKPRPPEASAKPPEQAAKPKNSADQEGEKTGEQAAPAPPVPSACRQALTDEIAIAPSIPDIHGPGACGGEDLVRLEAVVLPDKRRVSLKPAAILRCTMASAIADWIRTDMTALASSLGTAISD
ncbi:MAG: extensin family protein, partial [Bryobacteraceae bacterium]